jgi:hypothetical protein
MGVETVMQMMITLSLSDIHPGFGGTKYKIISGKSLFLGARTAKIFINKGVL